MPEIQGVDPAISPMKVKVFRKAQSRFELDFEGWFIRLNVQELISITQSESDGNVTITIIYR